MTVTIPHPDGDWAVYLTTPAGVTYGLDRIAWEGPHEDLAPRDAVVAIALVRHALQRLEQAFPDAAATAGGEVR